MIIQAIVAAGVKNVKEWYWVPVFSGGKPGIIVFTPINMALINCPRSLNLEYICSNMFTVKAPILV